MEFTNSRGISLPMAVWLAHDSYDYDPDPNVISATTLLKPLRQIVLARQNKDLQKVADLGDMLKSRVGTAVHDAIEQAWKSPHSRAKALNIMGLGHIADKIKVNPDPDTLKDGDIPVYMEQRVKKPVGVGDYKISGKYDMILNGRVIDFKNTSKRNWTDAVKGKDYADQGSLYKWLNPEKVTDDVIQIGFNFTDWTPYSNSKDDPAFAIADKVYALKTVDETDAWVKEKVRKIDFLISQPEYKLPDCTSEELWMKAPIFKVYKNHGDKVAMRGGAKFESRLEAESFRSLKSAGEVREIKSEATACKYCPVRTICSQAERLISQGLLNEVDINPMKQLIAS